MVAIKISDKDIRLLLTFLESIHLNKISQGESFQYLQNFFILFSYRNMQFFCRRNDCISSIIYQQGIIS